MQGTWKGRPPRSPTPKPQNQIPHRSSSIAEMGAVRISESAPFDQACWLCGGSESPRRWPRSATGSSDAHRADESRSILTPFAIIPPHVLKENMISETASHPACLAWHRDFCAACETSHLVMNSWRGPISATWTLKSSKSLWKLAGLGMA